MATPNFHNQFISQWHESARKGLSINSPVDTYTYFSVFTFGRSSFLFLNTLLTENHSLLDLQALHKEVGQQSSQR